MNGRRWLVAAAAVAAVWVGCGSVAQAQHGRCGGGAGMSRNGRMMYGGMSPAMYSRPGPGQYQAQQLMAQQMLARQMFAQRVQALQAQQLQAQLQAQQLQAQQQLGIQRQAAQLRAAQQQQAAQQRQNQPNGGR